MPDHSDFKRHAALLDRMAAALGIDLQDAAIAGAVGIDEISDAVLRCADCPDPDHCGTWLHSHAGGADGPPGYCRNTALLGRLAGHSDGETEREM